MKSRKRAQDKYSEKMPVMGLRLERDTKEKIKRKAKEEGISISEWIRKALKNIVNYKSM